MMAVPATIRAAGNIRQADPIDVVAAPRQPRIRRKEARIKKKSIRVLCEGKPKITQRRKVS